MNIRMKDVNWTVSEDGKSACSVEHAALAVLMDIRDEMKATNCLLGCFRVSRALDDLNSLGKWSRRRAPKRKKKAVTS
jgi:hypothetical protein